MLQCLDTSEKQLILYLQMRPLYKFSYKTKIEKDDVNWYI